VVKRLLVEASMVLIKSLKSSAEEHSLGKQNDKGIFRGRWLKAV